MEKGKFRINDSIYEGYYDPAVNWNGFAVPHFTNEVARQILDDQVEDWFYDETSTCFTTVCDNSREYDPSQTTDSGELLWSIGGMEWAWELVTDKLRYIPVSPDGFPLYRYKEFDTPEEAQASIAETIRARYTQQGYYSMSDRTRISLDEAIARSRVISYNAEEE